MIQMNNVVTLICGKTVKDAEGYPTLSIISESEVFADVSSVKRQQKDSAYRRGYDATLTVKVQKAEYRGEQFLRFESKCYEIKESYSLNEDAIELTCSDMRYLNGGFSA
jgi:hypothetical protein